MASIAGSTPPYPPHCAWACTESPLSAPNPLIRIAALRLGSACFRSVFALLVVLADLALESGWGWLCSLGYQSVRSLGYQSVCSLGYQWLRSLGYQWLYYFGYCCAALNLNFLRRLTWTKRPGSLRATALKSGSRPLSCPKLQLSWKADFPRWSCRPSQNSRCFQLVPYMSFPAVVANVVY